MIKRVSTMDVRARIGDMLDRVALRHDEFVIERKGKALAALVPVDKLQQMRRFARRQALDLMARQDQAAGELTDAAAMSLALEAQRAARGRLRQARARSKRSRT